MEPTSDQTQRHSLKPENIQNSIEVPHRRVQSSSFSSFLSIFRPSRKTSQEMNSAKDSFSVRDSTKLSPMQSFALSNCDLPNQEKKSSTLVSKLNEEISILSSQLSLSNNSISIYSQELQKTSEKLSQMSLELFKSEMKIKDLESENFSLRRRDEFLHVSKEVSMYKESDNSTFFINEGQSLTKNSAYSSPMTLGYLKKSIDYEELDSTLNNLCQQIGEKEGGKKIKINYPENWRIGIETLIKVYKNKCTCLVKKTFLLWTRNRYEKVVRLFVELIGKVGFRSRCFMFIALTKTEKLGKLRKLMIMKRFFRVWIRKCTVLTMNSNIICKILSIFTVLHKRTLLAKYHVWSILKAHEYSKLVNDKKKIKKCIDQWINFKNIEEDLKTQAFYSWRSYLSLTKIERLKKMRVYFSN